MVKKVTIMKLLSQSSVLTLKISDVVPVPERGFQTSLAASVTCGGDNRVVEGATWSPSSSAGPPASRVCEVGPEQCRQHEICRPANEKSRSGAACATVLRGQTRMAAASRLRPARPYPGLTAHQTVRLSGEPGGAAAHQQRQPLRPG